MRSYERKLLDASPNAAMVAPEAERALVAERANVALDRPLGMDDGTTEVVGDIAIAGVAAAHEAIERDDDGHVRHLGYVLALGEFTVYHAGDTVPHAELAASIRAAARGREIDVALLPINGRAPERRVAGNMDGVEAAQLAREIGARLAIPCHYEMFEFNTASPSAFVAACRRLGQPHAVLAAGGHHVATS